VLGHAPSELFGAAGIEYAPGQARSVICWLEAPVEDVQLVPSVLTIVDPHIPALRVSSGGSGAPGTQLLTVELHHDLPMEQIATAAQHALLRIGVVAHSAKLHEVLSAAAPTFPVPSAANVAVFARAQQRLAALGLDAEIVGGASDFGADALGEQIVQGLRAAEVLCP
jgi:hypothetical protein